MKCNKAFRESLLTVIGLIVVNGLFVSVTKADQLTKITPVYIDANRVIYSEEKSITRYIGAVTTVREGLEVKSDELVVYSNEQGGVEKLVALGNPTYIKQMSQDGQYIDFRSESLQADYFPEKSLWVLTQKAVAWKPRDQLRIKGDKIELFNKNGQLEEMVAQGKPTTIRKLLPNSDSVDYTSESLKVHYLPQQSLLTLTEKAVAWQPAEKLRVKGDQIDIFFHDDNRVKKMTSYGRPSRVRKLSLIDDQEEFRSKSLRTDYFPGELFILTKNAVVWKDDGTYVGEKIEYDLETKIAKAVSEPKSKKRVRVILQPQNK